MWCYKFYAVKYTDRNIGEYTHQDHQLQKEKTSVIQETIFYVPPGEKYDKNIFFIPTKASPIPIKGDYLNTKCLRDRQNTSTFLQYKLDKLCDMADANFNCIGHEFAHAASRRIWDDELAKICSYQDLIIHLNPTIWSKWLRSGKNEFGTLIWGYEPNDIKGIGVLDWVFV